MLNSGYMRNFFFIRNRLPGLLTALILLVQTVFAADVSYLHHEIKKPEVRKEITSKVSYAEVITRITVPSFFFHWISKNIAVDIPRIHYHNCIAFFINSHSFNTFYTFTSALAP